MADTQKQHHNFHRTDQALQLLPYLQDDKVAGVDEDGEPKSCSTPYLVLIRLAMRMADKTIPGTLTVVDTCYPSLELLGGDTGLSERTVRRALDCLTAHGWIRKTRIDGRKLRGRPSRDTEGTEGRTSSYDGCRYHVTPKWDLVSSKREQKSKKANEPAPFKVAASAPPTAEDLAVAASLAKPGPAPAQEAEFKGVSNERRQAREKVYAYLQEAYADHPTMTHANAKSMMSGAIEAALDEAKGDADLVLDLLARLGPKEKSLKESKQLGGYLRKSFAGWLREYTHSEKIDGILDQRIRWDWTVELEGDGEQVAEQLRRILAYRLGPDLVDYRLDRNEQGVACAVFDVSKSFAETWLDSHPQEESDSDSAQDEEEEYRYESDDPRPDPEYAEVPW